MNSLSIAQLTQLSGIKAHTIRIWEQRYQAFSPKRTEGNVRTYSDLDLKKLLNIVSLINSGYKISELCTMSNITLNELIEQLYVSPIHEDPERFVTQLISAGVEFNEPSFQKILSHCFLRFGVTDTYKNIIYPLLNQIGLMWSCDKIVPAQEHFMCNLIRQKILTATDGFPSPKKEGKKWLLFLREDEYHEMGLLFAQFILRQMGETVYYLGANLPLSTLSVAIRNIKPDALVVFFVHNDFPENIDSYLAHLKKGIKNTPIYISGNEKLIEQIKQDKNIIWLQNIEDLESAVLKLSV
jgi:DNA-binding transcriptional MerR regulator